MGLCEKLRQLAGEPGHLLLEGFAVVLLLLNAHIPAGGQDVVLPGDVPCRSGGAEALHIFQCSLYKIVVGIRYLLDVLPAQLPQLAGDHRAHLPGVDKQSFAFLLFVPGEEPQGNGDLGGVEKLGGHGHDTVHQVRLDDVFPDIPLAAGLGGKGAVGQHHAHAPVGGQVVNHVLEPRKVGVARRRRPILPAHIVLQFIRPPVGEVKRRVCHDIIRPQGGVAIVKKGIGVISAQVGVNAPDGQVHLRHLPGGGVGILPIDRNIIDVPGVVFHEFRRLHEHAAAAAAGVVHPPVEGLEHLHQRFYHAFRREKFPRQLALVLGELPQAVLIGVAQNIPLAAVLDHLDIGEQVHHVAQAALVQFRAGEVFRQDIFEAFIFLFNAAHSVVDDFADLRRMRRRGNHTPAGVRRHKKDPLGSIFIDVLLEAVAFLHQRLVFFLKTVGNIF